MNAPIPLEIVGRDPLFRESFAVALAKNPRFSVLSHGTGFEHALEHLDRTVARIVLIDLTDAAEDAVRFVQGLGDRDPRAILLGGAAHHPMAIRCLEAGARGFVSHDDALEALDEAIEIVLSGGVAAPPEIVAHVLTRLSDLSNAEWRRRSLMLSKITSREGQILELLAEGLTNREIAERLSLSAHTVKNHLYELFRKLEVSSRGKAIQAARRQGWLEGVADRGSKCSPKAKIDP